MIKKSLVFTLSDTSDEQNEVVNVKTFSDGNTIIDILVDVKKFPININDLETILAETKKWLELNKENTKDLEQIMTIVPSINGTGIEELEVMSLDHIPEKVLDDEIPF